MPPRKGDLLMIAIVKIDDTEYGTFADFDSDTRQIIIHRLNHRKIWKYQNYKTSNGRKMRRCIRVSPVKNAELHRAVVEAFKVKYQGENQ